MESKERKEPSFFIKWIAGIAASVIGAILIAEFVIDQDEANEVPTRQYDTNSGISFEYPVFMGGVREMESSTNHIVEVGRSPSLSLNLRSIFNSDLVSTMRFTLEPFEHFRARRRSSTTADQGTQSREEPSIVLGKLAREIETQGKESVAIYDVQDFSLFILVSKNFYTHSVVLHVTAVFHRETWERYEASIKSLFDSIQLDENTARIWLLNRLERLTREEQLELVGTYGDNWCSLLTVNLELYSPDLNAAQKQKMQADLESQSSDSELRTSIIRRCKLQPQ